MWSPDSRRILFASSRAGAFNLYWQAADGTGAPERLTESRNQQIPHTITPDGAEILFREVSGVGGQSDLMRLLMGSPARSPAPGVSKTATPLMQTMFDERNAELAPKGQWLAYESNESGRFEVYVRPFPTVDSGRWQVSTSGGRTPVWSRSSDELFYVAPDGTIHGVRVEAALSWRNSTPTKVLQAAYYLPPPGATVGADLRHCARRQAFPDDQAGQRRRCACAAEFIVVEDWLEELKRLVPTK